MDLSNIGHFIEISQVGQMFNGTVWVHSDPVSTTSDADVKKEVCFNWLKSDQSVTNTCPLTALFSQQLSVLLA